MPDKLCAFCVHFDWERMDYHYYSTLTGGDLEGGMYCKKGHFHTSNPEHLKDYRETILLAEKCPDYKPDID